MLLDFWGELIPTREALLLRLYTMRMERNRMQPHNKVPHTDTTAAITMLVLTLVFSPVGAARGWSKPVVLAFVVLVPLFLLLLACSAAGALVIALEGRAGS
jgi:hypothetical protein